jgi:hypothetical protein
MLQNSDLKHISGKGEAGREIEKDREIEGREK